MDWFFLIYRYNWILLIHDGVQETVDILPQVNEYLENRSFEFVTIDEMMGTK